MSQPTPYQNAFSRIELFRNEEAGWDGMMGKPASETTCENAKAFLGLAQEAGLPKPAGATLSAAGHISVIWRPNDWYIMVRFCEQDEYVFIAINQGKQVACGKAKVADLDPDLARWIKESTAQEPHHE